jgi:hypothetical protein
MRTSHPACAPTTHPCHPHTAAPQEPAEPFQLVGRAAPAFPAVSARVGGGSWRPFRLQVSWMLLLLAVKAPANRMLISKVERASIAPLATQLENAERCRASGLAGADAGDEDEDEEEDEEEEGDEEVECGNGERGSGYGARAVAGSAPVSAASAPARAALPPAGTLAPPTVAAGPVATWVERAPSAPPPPAPAADATGPFRGANNPAAQGGAATRALPHAPSGEASSSGAFVLGDGEDEDDIEMLQQEVAFLSLSTRRRQASAEGGGGDGTGDG